MKYLRSPEVFKYSFGNEIQESEADPKIYVEINYSKSF